jgi:hypothetical protein
MSNSAKTGGTAAFNGISRARFVNRSKAKRGSMMLRRKLPQQRAMVKRSMSVSWSCSPPANDVN